MMKSDHHWLFLLKVKYVIKKKDQPQTQRLSKNDLYYCGQFNPKVTPRNVDELKKESRERRWKMYLFL